MKRLFIAAIAIAVALALSTPAFALWTEAGNSTITVTLDLASETWIQYQDDSYGEATGTEPDIVFGTGAGAWPADPWRPEGLIGIYDYDSTKPPTQADATGWYESEDGATIYLKSNVDLTGTITVSGPLTSGSHTLPSWFTVCVNGYDEDTATKVAFPLGNSQSGDQQVDDGNPPGAGGPGGYGGNNGGGGEDLGGPRNIWFGNQDFFPGQDVFRMMNTAYTMDMNAPVGPGTMKFLARVERSGLADYTGTYTATLAIGFATP